MTVSRRPSLRAVGTPGRLAARRIAPAAAPWGQRAALAVLLLAVSCAADGTPAPEVGLEQFWTQFRAAVLAGDKNTIATLTAFPFTTRGPLDDDPEQALDRASFVATLDRLLAQDPGLRAEPDTMRALIERTPAIPPGDVGGGGQTARVGSFVFQRVGGQWRFTRAYTEE